MPISVLEERVCIVLIRFSNCVVCVSQIIVCDTHTTQFLSLRQRRFTCEALVVRQAAEGICFTTTVSQAVR
jgi:hypothetical protein